jgi:hypothetical protein
MKTVNVQPSPNFYISEECARAILGGFSWAYSEGCFDEIESDETSRLLFWIQATYPELSHQYSYLPFPD